MLKGFLVESFNKDYLGVNMAIFRGIGGAGDSTTDATVTAVTEQATNAANRCSALNELARRTYSYYLNEAFILSEANANY